MRSTLGLWTVSPGAFSLLVQSRICAIGSSLCLVSTDSHFVAWHGSDEAMTYVKGVDVCSVERVMLNVSGVMWML